MAPSIFLRKAIAATPPVAIVMETTSRSTIAFYACNASSTMIVPMTVMAPPITALNRVTHNA